MTVVSDLHDAINGANRSVRQDHVVMWRAINEIKRLSTIGEAHKFTGDGPGVKGADNCQICFKWHEDHAEWETTPPDKINKGTTDTRNLRSLARLGQELWRDAEKENKRLEILIANRDVVITTILTNLRHGSATNDIIKWFDGDGKELLKATPLPPAEKITVSCNHYPGQQTCEWCQGSVRQTANELEKAFLAGEVTKRAFRDVMHECGASDRRIDAFIEIYEAENGPAETGDAWTDGFAENH